MSRPRDIYHSSGLAAQADSIRDTVRRFDAITLGAADSIREGERLGDVAMLDAATAAAPHAPGIVTLLSALDHLTFILRGALPELVNDANVARITDALRPVENTLNSYLADPDPVRLADALGTEIQNLHQALRRSFGYWQMARGSGQEGRNPEPVADFDLRPERRRTFAGKLLAALDGWVPGSLAELRGSMGSGNADDYSDIDICWTVPDDSFTEAVDTVGAALSCTIAVLSLRTDPGFARSARRRLVFARLYGLPLFWRVDIDIRANSVAADDLYDAGKPDARSEAGWSRPASAIENAVAAIRAAARGQADAADGLLRRGFERIGQDPGPATDLADAITSLAVACATQEPGLKDMATEISQVVDRLLPPADP